MNFKRIEVILSELGYQDVKQYSYSKGDEQATAHYTAKYKGSYLEVRVNHEEGSQEVAVFERKYKIGSKDWEYAGWGEL